MESHKAPGRGGGFTYKHWSPRKRTLHMNRSNGKLYMLSNYLIFLNKNLDNGISIMHLETTPG